MAVAHVQTKSDNAISTTDDPALSFNTLPSAGNTVVVLLSAYTTDVQMPSNACSDNQGNTYTRRAFIRNSITSNFHVAIFDCIGIGSPSGTFTVTVADGGTGSYYGAMAILEFSGVATFSGAESYESSVSSTTASVTKTGALASALQVATLSVVTSKNSITVQSLSPTWVEVTEQLSAATSAGETDYRIADVDAGDFTAQWAIDPADGSLSAVALYGSAVASQFARPSSVVAAGNWDGFINGVDQNDSSNLDNYIDEATTPDDTDSIRSTTSPDNDTCTIGITGITSPGAGTVTMRIRARFL